MARIRVSAQARADLLEIWLYIARDSIDSAERNLTFQEKFRALAAQPEIGRGRDELLGGMRSFPVGNYQIYYEPMAGGIRVLRVLHSARDTGKIFS